MKPDCCWSFLPLRREPETKALVNENLHDSLHQGSQTQSYVSPQILPCLCFHLVFPSGSQDPGIPAGEMENLLDSGSLGTGLHTSNGPRFVSPPRQALTKTKFYSNIVCKPCSFLLLQLLNVVPLVPSAGRTPKSITEGYRQWLQQCDL